MKNVAKEKIFKRENTVTIYSKYRSVNGYILFYMIDTKHNLISPIQNSNSTVKNMYHSHEQKGVKNFAAVKNLHNNAMKVFKLVEI